MSDSSGFTRQMPSKTYPECVMSSGDTLALRGLPMLSQKTEPEPQVQQMLQAARVEEAVPP